MFGIYLHWPFCQQKCAYCNFLSFSGKESLILPYVEAIVTEIKKVGQIKNWPAVSSIYFGGGNPLTAGAENLTFILQTIRNSFLVAKNAEITVEGNPETVSLKKLMLLKKTGFNRLSIGAQSFNNSFLKFLGRTHTAEDIKKAVFTAFQAGFTNINLDLMYGLPGQTVKQWEDDLKAAIKVNVKHISTYALTVEPHTALAALNLELNEEETSKAYKLSLKLLPNAGFYQYELSNFAQQGYECWHNLNYWLGGDYLGFGVGAVSYVNGKRFQRETKLNAYLKKIKSRHTTICASEELSWRQRAGEVIILQLRLNKLNLINIKQQLNLDAVRFYQNETVKLCKQRLLQKNFQLTVKGKLLANEVMSCFV